MKKISVLLMLSALALSACQTSDQNAAAGAVGGAALGAALSSRSDRTTGALIGAATGVAASTLVRPAGSRNNNQCYYRDSRGQRYIASC